MLSVAGASPAFAADALTASHHEVKMVPALGWSLPFALLLLAIAVLPIMPVAHHWWERNTFKLAISLVLGSVVVGHYALRGYGYDGKPAGMESVLAVLEHALLRDFIPFLVLITSLYVISGGVQLKGDLRSVPGVNTSFLALGAVVASLVGTTGASMILIRPLLQTNRDREHVRHTVVFFIFLVSNIGGCLLPTGDPPLFLGYLQGVPFLWTFSLIGPWLFCVTTLLAVYFVWDTRAYRRETRAHLADDRRHDSPPRLHGGINLLWLLGVLMAVALVVPGRPLPGTEIVAVDYLREGIMLALAGLSWFTTPHGLRKETEYSNAAILEVACLFLGIFLTMQVPIEILQSRGAELGLTTPTHFFWATGSLSSVLDNAPTYLVFLETGRSIANHEGASLVDLIGGSIRHDILAAISLGAVFMGANTYIGNAPNMMVKLIAEQRRVRMPSFFGYMVYSVCILVPLFGLVSLIFFR